jgi:hypothetical protein
LDQCEFAINSTVSTAHSRSPFEVVFGFVPSLPLDTALELRSHTAEDLVAARIQVHTQVKELLAKSAAAMEKSTIRDRRPSPFAVGASVWLSTRHLPLRHGARKLAELWTGPFDIDAQVAPEAWRLRLPRTWRVHPVFHSSQLKPALGAARRPPPIALEEEEPEFEVKEILDHRTVRGQT